MHHFFRNYFVFFFLSVIILATTWPLFSSDFFIFHDFTQAARIVEMSTALKDLHLPTLWSENLGYGYGMPLFEFYAPLPYYVGSLFYLLGFSLIQSVKLLLFIPAVVGAIGAYRLGKLLFGSLGGLLVSASLSLAPYKAVNMYVRGAVSESWGAMTIPLILLGSVMIIKKEKNGWVVLVLSLLVLLLSHNLTAVLFLPFAVLFALGYFGIELWSQYSGTKVVLEKTFLQKIVSAILTKIQPKPAAQSKLRIILQKTAQTAAIFVSCYLLAFGLSAFYSAPAFLEKDFTRLESAIVSDYFDYKLHFVGLKQFFTSNWGYGGSTYGPEDDMSFYLGFGQIVGFVVAMLLFFRAVITRSKNAILLFCFSSGLFVVSLLLATQRSQFIWDSVSLLSFIQFPWRYLTVATAFLALAVGATTIFISNKFIRMGYSFALLFVVILGNMLFFQPEAFINQQELSDYYYADTGKLRTQMSATLPDYIPAQISTQEISPVAFEGQVLYCQVLGNCQESLQGSFAIQEDKVHTKTLRFDLETQQTVVFAIAYFPGWQVRIESQPGVIVTQSISQEGFLQATLPAGENTVHIELESTPTRKTAQLISAVSLLILLSTLFWYYNKKHARE